MNNIPRLIGKLKRSDFFIYNKQAIFNEVQGLNEQVNVNIDAINKLIDLWNSSVYLVYRRIKTNNLTVTEDAVIKNLTAEILDVTNLKIKGKDFFEYIESIGNGSGNGGGSVNLKPIIDRIEDLEKRYEVDIKTLNDNITEIYSDVCNFHANVSLSANKSIIEKGVTTTVTLTAKSTFGDKFANTLTVTPNVVLTGLTNASKTGVAEISDTTTYKLVGTFNYGVSKTASVTVTAKNPIFYFGSKVDNISYNDIDYSSKVIKNTPTGSYTIRLSENLMYFYICVPSEMSINKITLNGFDIPMNAPQTIAIPNKGNYKYYRSINTNDAGTYTIIIS